MSKPSNRRDFLKTSALVGAGYWVAGTRSAAAATKSPNEKLNIAGIGVGGMGGSNVKACSDENIVALCDVDADYAAKTFKEYPKAKTYTDFRVMLEKQKDIDAVIVATPDHTHAPIALAAMRAGKHVYVQKPMTHSVAEARMLTEEARRRKVINQMGNQGRSGDGTRLVCEWVWARAIGKIREVHVWTNRPVWPQGIEVERPKETPEVPSSLIWDQWVGPAPMRPYHPTYLRGNWRAWWDFGTGSLGDMGCHLLDAPFSALKLKYPVSVEACISSYWHAFFQKTNPKKETYPRSEIVRYKFPARDELPAVDVTWWDGGLMPARPAGVPIEAPLGDGDGGAIFIGDQGVLICGCYGRDPHVYPAEKMKELAKLPQTLERIPGSLEGHEKNWIQACKGGKPCSSNFDYAGPLSEMVLMGNLAVRHSDRLLLWDGEKMEVTNYPKANEYVHQPYRDGWTL